jgi:hypothetical protein
VIDLHVHTTCSDGTLTPAEVVALAARKGLSAVAITDHDTVDGLEEALAAGLRLGVEVVPGVEINAEHQQVTLDVLGYFLSAPPDDELREQLAELRHYRDVRNTQILERLAQLGYPVSAGELAEIAGGEAVGRPHISEAFTRFLRRGAPAFVDRRRLAMGKAVCLLVRSGAAVAIAHPAIIRTDDAGLLRLAREAARQGAVGFECYYGAYCEADLRRTLAIAAELDLVPTGGSDFHGRIKPDAELGAGPGGAPIPDGVLADLKQRAARGRRGRMA